MSLVHSSRILALEHTFMAIAHTRMRDVPLQNPALRVQAVGFGWHQDADVQVLLGVLITPWFMNLVRLPWKSDACGIGATAVGEKVERSIGAQSFEFIRAFEDGLGPFEACSLFSPMFEFADQAAACATARAVLDLLHQGADSAARPAVVQPSRRGFLFGRSDRAAAGA
ncbi:MAG: [NiFe]-hydrogenase assembly chaperone HybE [Burkholderiales bacterium]|nr:[NiFe]-hydrogenase assembly chaperone HybE [Burkholderiales bacterium]